MGGLNDPCFFYQGSLRVSLFCIVGFSRFFPAASFPHDVCFAHFFFPQSLFGATPTRTPSRSERYELFSKFCLPLPKHSVPVGETPNRVREAGLMGKLIHSPFWTGRVSERRSKKVFGIFGLRFVV